MKFGLIGEKLSHSFSKEIHSLINKYEYELLEVKRDALAKFMKDKNFIGINVTIPYKQTVIPYLDKLDEHCKEIGSVNTIVNKNGKLFGYNTDFYGMKALFQKSGINAENKKCLILGTGGTSKTAYAVLKNLKAKEIFFVSRNKTNNTITYDEAVLHHTDTEIIVNTTPVGMYPNTEDVPTNLENFKSLEGVLDVVYNPLRTNLLLQAQKMGIKAIGGLYMLCAQAVYASEIFTGEKASAEIIDDIYNKIILKKENVVLIGMPGSGKSTIGRQIKTKTFIDTDEEIEKQIQTSIKDYIELNGEDEFRKIESDVIKEVSLGSGCVISTGGGAVLNPSNVTRLKRNGRIFFLDAPLERLEATASRPLSNTKEKLKKLYCDRKEIYENSADVKINADGNVSDTLEKVKEWL